MSETLYCSKCKKIKLIDQFKLKNNIKKDKIDLFAITLQELRVNYYLKNKQKIQTAGNP